jgi:CheY-like chemotaxis protein/HPt (histidine-containing phosphotransfer) domain-containing protein
MQGGSIHVSSKVNEGTTFSFIIPYEKGDESMMAAELEETVNFKDLDSLKILVAEDVALNQFLIKHILESWGCEVTIVSNGKDAVEKVKKQPFDVILMDIQMPEMDGITATKIIRTLYIVDKSVITKKIRTLNAKDKSAIPIIALTANALKGDGERYMEIGMNGYITKPYTEEKLFHIINQVVQTNSSPNVKAAVPAQPLQETPDIVVKLGTAPAPVMAPKLYDLTFINSISKGDEEFGKKIINIFLETMPALQDTIVMGGEENNNEIIARTAHKMKSNIDLLGIHSLKEIIRKLEHIETAPGSAGERSEWIEKVSRTLKDVCTQLKEQVL